MKILSWNVNGLKPILFSSGGEGGEGAREAAAALKVDRAMQRPGFGSMRAMMDSLGADIVCLQETKLVRGKDLSPWLAGQGSVYDETDHQTHDDQLHGWECFPSFAESIVGYSGVATVCRSPGAVPVAAEDGLTGRRWSKPPATSNSSQGEECDIHHALSINQRCRIQDWLSPAEQEKVDNEGRCVITDHGAFVLFNCYLPNGGSFGRTLFKMIYHSCLLERVRQFRAAGREVVITGDLNVCYLTLDTCELMTAYQKHRSGEATAMAQADLLSWTTDIHRQWMRSLMLGRSFLWDAQEYIAARPDYAPPGGDSGRVRGKSALSAKWMEHIRCEVPPTGQGRRINVDDSDDEDDAIAVAKENGTGADGSTNDIPKAMLMGLDLFPGHLDSDDSQIPFEFLDSFRIYHPNRLKAYTCWDSVTSARLTNYGARIDFVLISKGLKSKLTGADIMPEVMGSDHCPVYAELNVSSEETERIPELSARLQMASAPRQRSIRQLFASGTAGTTTISVDVSMTQTLEPTASQISTQTDSQTPTQSVPSLTSQSSSAMGTQPPPAKRQKKQATLFAVMKGISQPEKLVPKEESQPRAAPETTPQTTQSATEPLGAFPSMPRQENDKSFMGLFKPIPKPKCTGHKEPCVERVVKNGGENHDRKFWVCCRPKGEKNDRNARCNFFIWHDEWLRKIGRTEGTHMRAKKVKAKLK
eukprot:Clim_evm43s44 gene=Clim_evmTU43s44